jgi:hypothetical protein
LYYTFTISQPFNQYEYKSDNRQNIKTPQQISFRQQTELPVWKPQSSTNDQLECGISGFQKPKTTGLIVGGREAVRGQFPW